MSQEDAAALLSEFIYQIDNLPAEVAFILEEIGYKDDKVQGERCVRRSGGAGQCRMPSCASGYCHSDAQRIFTYADSALTPARPVYCL